MEFSQRISAYRNRTVSLGGALYFDYFPYAQLMTQTPNETGCAQILFN
jgi:hypothetical protein